jgi:hypothetical protein
MLRSLAKNREEIVAWRDIDDGPRDESDYLNARAAWNREQTMRRALRSLERRGLVELGRYVFFPEPVERHLSISIVWTVIDPDDHVPGESRIMTGVRLTALGREAAEHA